VAERARDAVDQDSDQPFVIGSLAETTRGEKELVVIDANDAHLLSDVELRAFSAHARVGTPGPAVVPELAPSRGDLVVGKRLSSAFTRTDLAGTLADHDVGRLVLGKHTDCCIRHESYDAWRAGYELAVCRDVTTAYQAGSEEPIAARQERTLTYLTTYYGARIERSSDVS
jgi:nicotinamidase-related amidase